MGDQEMRRFKAQLKVRLERLDRGEGIELEDDEALGRFLDGIEAEVEREIASRQVPRRRPRET